MVVVVEVPTCRKLLQVAPVQRSIKYWLMVPPVSVAAVQERLICVLLAAVAVRLDGAVKVGAAVVAVTVLEYGPAELAECMARTRLLQVVDAGRTVPS